MVGVRIFYKQYSLNQRCYRTLEALSCTGPLSFSHQMVDRSHGSGGRAAEVTEGTWVGLGFRAVYLPAS